MTPDQLEQFAENAVNDILKGLPIEWRLAGISPDELVELFTPSQRLQCLSIDELLAVMSPEMKAALAKRLNTASTDPNPPPRDANP